MTDLSERLAGRFIVLDGPDGSGKSTQLGLLCEWLAEKGVAVECARDPGGTDVGERVRRILLDGRHGNMSVACEMLLYMASRAQLVAERIAPVLAAGGCVLCDRFISATVAYQGAAGADVQEIEAVGEIACAHTRPDLTILLDLPVETGLGRLGGAGDRMESKDPAFHRKVRELFLAQARAHPERFAVVDAAGDAQQVQTALRRVIQEWDFSE